MSGSGLYPLPSEEKNCKLIEVTEEEVSSCVRLIPKLETLILVKCMVKNHSFQNPFVKCMVKTNSFPFRMNPCPSPTSERTPRMNEPHDEFVRSQSAPGLYDRYLQRCVYCMFCLMHSLRISLRTLAWNLNIFYI